MRHATGAPQSILCLTVSPRSCVVQSHSSVDANNRWAGDATPKLSSIEALPPKLLKDDQVIDFIKNGFLVLPLTELRCVLLLCAGSLYPY